VGPLKAEEPAMITSCRIWPKARAALFVAILTIGAGGWSEAQQPKARSPNTVRLYVFDCGIIDVIDPSVLGFKKDELAETRFAVPCFLIVHPKGTLMWDVGIAPDAAFKDDGTPVTQTVIPGVSTFTAARTLKSQLAEIGYAPSDITYLGLSHYHRDHVANANEFATATWLVRKVERDAMFSDKPPSDPKNYSELKNSQTIILTTDEYDVFGDGKVIIKFAPGHTPGHQVLIVKLAHTGNVMLAGDLYHYPEERTTNRVPIRDFSKEQSLASRAMIEEYVRKTNTQLWIEHDFAANARLKKSPQYYD
jgi:glyoxylase-like metal-dependent hydrolase (beta-lactamase superfamily II)